MPSEKFLQLLGTIESAIIPVDTQTGANDGDWVNMENYHRMVALYFGAVGTAGDDPVFTLKQATAAAGTGAKDLDFTVVYEKVGTLTAVTAWTRVTQAAAATYTNAASAEAQKLIAVEISADDLDVDGGFNFVQLSIPDTGAGGAQLGCGLYIMLEPRYPQAAQITAVS